MQRRKPESRRAFPGMVPVVLMPAGTAALAAEYEAKPNSEFTAALGWNYWPGTTTYRRSGRRTVCLLLRE